MALDFIRDLVIDEQPDYDLAAAADPLDLGGDHAALDRSAALNLPQGIVRQAPQAFCVVSNLRTEFHYSSQVLLAHLRSRHCYKRTPQGSFLQGGGGHPGYAQKY